MTGAPEITPQQWQQLQALVGTPWRPPSSDRPGGSCLDVTRDALKILGCPVELEDPEATCARWYRARRFPEEGTTLEGFSVVSEGTGYDVGDVLVFRGGGGAFHLGVCLGPYALHSVVRTGTRFQKMSSCRILWAVRPDWGFVPGRQSSADVCTRPGTTPEPVGYPFNPGPCGYVAGDTCDLAIDADHPASFGGILKT